MGWLASACTSSAKLRSGVRSSIDQASILARKEGAKLSCRQTRHANRDALLNVSETSLIKSSTAYIEQHGLLTALRGQEGVQLLHYEAQGAAGAGSPLNNFIKVPTWNSWDSQGPDERAPLQLASCADSAAAQHTLKRILEEKAKQAVTLDAPPHVPPSPQLPRRALQQPLFEGNGSPLVFGGASGALQQQRVEAALHNLRQGVPGTPSGAAHTLLDIGKLRHVRLRK
eukprot:1161110-Pelagomonas_calceolata.AAC.8